MTKPRSFFPDGTDSAAAEARLDPVEADRRRQARSRRYNVVTLPVIRLLALNAIAAAVVLHHWLVGPAVSPSALAVFLAAVELYCLGSWGLLLLLWERLKGRGDDVRLGLITVDVVTCIVATYITGGERSWLFFFAAARLADAGIGFRAALALGHVTPLLYVAMLWYVGHVDGRPIPFGPAAVNTYMLYITTMYFAIIGRTATMLRERLVSAIRVSRELIAELRDKSERLELATHKANEASLAKARLLATVSHELRTPLTAIIEHTELVMEEADPETDATIMDDLAQVVVAARQLSGIIDDLLDVSRIEVDQAPHVERFDVVHLLEEVTDRSAPLAAGNGNTLVVTQAAAVQTIRTDRAKLRQILLILLGNAAKFTSNGEIRLDVQPAGGDGGIESVAFDVSDTGIGIPENIRAVLYTPFTQGDSSPTRKYGGTGLGLVIAKRYAELISAELSYETTVGVGTRFSLVVPAAPLAEQDVFPAAHSQPTPPTDAGP
ncbi:MAG: HAMP domain-containing histidine kinase [Gemmatimonadaceae bacterium]|nr:HAMP domain-containing histidine kinase [Gemmatimonadaceae bacterium]